MSCYFQQQIPMLSLYKEKQQKKKREKKDKQSAHFFIAGGSLYGCN